MPEQSWDINRQPPLQRRADEGPHPFVVHQAGDENQGGHDVRSLSPLAGEAGLIRAIPRFNHWRRIRRKAALPPCRVRQHSLSKSSRSFKILPRGRIFITDIRPSLTSGRHCARHVGEQNSVVEQEEVLADLSDFAITRRWPGQHPDRLQLYSCSTPNGTKISIALEEIGRDIPNTCLLGAFASATKWLKLDSLIACLKEYLSGDILDKNIRSMQRGFREVKITQWQ